MKTNLTLLPDNIITLFNKIFIIFCSLIFFDFFYLTLSNKYYYISKNPINLWSAILSWILISYILSIQNSLSIIESLIYGIIIGLVVYGTFNLVNFSILKEWKLNIVIMDTIWGMIVCSLSSIISFLIFK